ncbi:hypothetical protein PFX98_04705 [Paucibacter sediminis]|uniref:Uncharacterized protein n=1 Tax=Paucibacter sediminis TaxID=3019553 RepID=A0AA95NG13_9BURK|nr:hypothetical protein [Paucibacter sp. S2-9]WIT12913.1 hypothetical protein PFX98_04705 [Paucibacter sp. S2-9]
MHVLRHAPEVSAFMETCPDLGVVDMIRQRHEELMADDESSMEELVFFVIPEADDTVAQVEAVLGSPLRTAEGHPLWEVIEMHDTCYEMVFVLTSSGYGALVLVSKQDSHSDLLDLCQSHAVKAHPTATP